MAKSDVTMNVAQNHRNKRPMMARVGLMLRNSFTINGFQQLTCTLLRGWFLFFHLRLLH